MTHTWVLILSMMGTSGQGVAINFIPAFSSQQECEVAANKWTKAFPESSNNAIRQAVCVEQSGTPRKVD